MFLTFPTDMCNVSGTPTKQTNIHIPVLRARKNLHPGLVVYKSARHGYTGYAYNVPGNIYIR
jgi:hypothetical protein